MMSLGNYTWNADSVFTNPSFGVDTTNAFSGLGSSLSSSPFTKGASAGMDPGTALAISAGSSALSGGIGAAGSKKGANKAKQAAEAQARAVQQASENAPLIGFGMEAAGKQFDKYLGAPLSRQTAFDTNRMQGAMEFGPTSLARQRTQLAQELAGIRSQAYGKEMDPFQRFV